MSSRDIELYHRIQQKDKQALEEIYTKYEKLLYSFAFKMCGDKELAEEMIQDVFMKLWTDKATYDESKGKFSSWLLTVARYTGIDLIRKRKNNHVTLEEEQDSLHEETPSSEDIVVWKEQRALVQKAVRSLSREQIQMVDLFYFKGHTQKEIADQCDLPLGTVKGRIRLALKHLKKELENIKRKGGVQDV
ncbi:RNA polymerase sigma factor [Thalassobacillus hwangdonensis]|uniref:RNA polymerase sigma factor n=1 Tax=Thalassobacillus hwangdonensis TaxID=546108 RepID=A0ABW3L257_9BACI